MSTNYLLFETKIPLVHRDTYEIHKIIAVPRLVNNNIMIHIKPVSSFLAINLQKEALLPITESELKSCLQQESGTLLCKTKSPVYTLKDDESLCERDAATGRCRIYEEPCQSQWHELNQVNTYFYFYCKQQNVKLLCDDQVSSLPLLYSGLLTINDGCILKFKDFTVYTHKQEMSTLHFKADIIAPNLSPINYFFNISVPTLGATNASDKDDVSEHSKRLIQLQEQIEEMKQTVPLYDSISSHDIHHYTATYIIVAVAIVGAAIWGSRKILRRRSAQAAAERTERPTLATPRPAAARRRPPSSTTVIDQQCVCSASDDSVK
ncbi:uncharacterized protein LOC123661774 [Melitaea cinxia]|uniref:uncharacterized protein LOC123661774 n=1 Tax=Melitaea cinxia TaxID=113334 RepID=UPI001E273127|nr:uncharacterized protein LOC123661774 [Melitaea cinxia]